MNKLKIIKALKSAQEYCREQNGLPICKNCGLDFDDLVDDKYKYYQSIEQAIIRSEEWQKWEEYNNMKWDTAETRECGWMSDEHWQDFVRFIRNNK